MKRRLKQTDLGNWLTIPKQAAPVVQTSSTTFSVIKGRSHTIIVTVSGNPRVTELTWSKTTSYGTEVINSLSDKYAGGTPKCPSLTINSFSENDSGTYVCIAKNSVGTRESQHIVLKCVAGTHVEVSPWGTVRIGHGSTTELTGNVIYSSPRNITLDFQKVNNNIPTSLVIHNVKYSGSSLDVRYPKLCINDIEINDAGVYQLKATSATETVYSNQVVLEVFGDPALSLTKEENNFLRCYLLCHQIATKSVRLFFNSYVPETTLNSHLNAYRSDLSYGNIRKGIQKCTIDQINVLYPATTGVPVKSIHFDFSLLYKLLRNTVANISPPTKGWGCQPSQCDTKGSDDVERVRHSRNTIAHNTSLEMSETEFQEFWSDLSQASDRLSKGQLKADIEELKTKKFDRHQKNNDLEEIRTNLKQMQKELKELSQDVADFQRGLNEVKYDIAENKVKINEIRDTYIPRNVREGHLQQLEQWRTDDSLYYETHVYESAKDMVNSNAVVTFVGGPGSGKTALIQHIALQFEKGGWEIVPVCRPEEIVLYANPYSRQIFILNDVFGIFSLDINLYNNVVNHTDRILGALGKQSKILFTCRTQVYNEVLSLKSALMKNIFNLQSIENELNGNDRTEILTRHCENKGVEKKIYNSISLESCTLMFPLLCKLFSSEHKYHHFGKKFFIQPSECLLIELDRLQIISRNHYSALVLCLLSGEKTFEISMIKKEIKNEVFNTCGVNLGTSDRQIIDALDYMTGTYILKTVNGYTFIHDAIYEVIAYHYGKYYQRQIIKYMPSSYIATKVVVCTDSSNQLCIEISEKLYPDLADRLYSDIQDMQLYYVFINKSLSSSQFLEVFFKTLKEKPYLEFKELFLCKQENVGHIVWIVENWTQSLQKQTYRSTMSTEKERQKLLLDYVYLIELDISQYCIRIISWIIYYGHHNLLHSIVNYVLEQNDSTDLIFSSNIYEQARLLTLGCFSGNLDLVELILKYVNKECINSKLIVDPEYGNVYRTITPFGAACSLGHLDILDLLTRHQENINLKDIYGRTPINLAIAVANGHLNVLDYLVRHGADTTVKGNEYQSLLQIASVNGYYDISKYIIDRGVNVDICDSGGRSSLFEASRYGHFTIVKLLIENNANVNLSDVQKSSPLHQAISKNHTNIVMELLNNGANPNLCDIYNESPLYKAVKNGHSQLVKLLLQHEADVSIRDKNGISPLDLSLLSNSADILKDLVRRENHLAINQGNCHLFDIFEDLRRLTPPAELDFGPGMINEIGNPHRLWNEVWKIIAFKGLNDLQYLFHIGLNREIGNSILHRFFRCTYVEDKVQKFSLLIENGTTVGISDDVVYIDNVIRYELDDDRESLFFCYEEDIRDQKYKDLRDIKSMIRKFRRRKSV